MDQHSTPTIQSVIRTFQAHYGLIISVAGRYAPTPDLVFDIVNQVFIDFLEGATKGNWDPTRDPAPFLFAITKNRAMKQWRQEKRHSSATIQKVGEELMKMRRNKEEDAESMNESLELLKHCMEKLPPKSRELVEEHYLREVSLKKIARLRAVSSHTLSKTLFRIRLKLRDCVDRSLRKTASHES